MTISHKSLFPAFLCILPLRPGLRGLVGYTVDETQPFADDLCINPLTIKQRPSRRDWDQKEPHSSGWGGRDGRVRRPDFTRRVTRAKGLITSLLGDSAGSMQRETPKKHFQKQTTTVTTTTKAARRCNRCGVVNSGVLKNTRQKLAWLSRSYDGYHLLLWPRWREAHPRQAYSITYSHPLSSSPRKTRNNQLRAQQLPTLYSLLPSFPSFSFQFLYLLYFLLLTTQLTSNTTPLSTQSLNR